MEELLGKKIDAIYISECRTYLAFIYNLSGDSIVYIATGDCCSETWFESIINPEIIIGEYIIEIGIKNSRIIAKDADETIESNGYILKTKKGYTDIEYRNSSNGYYWGDCELLNNYILLTDKEKEINQLTIIEKQDIKLINKNIHETILLISY